MGRLDHSGARALLIAGAAALAAMLAVGAYLFFDSYSTDSSRVHAGAVSEFPPHTVTYIPAARAFLVHEDGDDYFALYEQSPWLQVVHPTGYDQCHVRWYPIPAGEGIPYVDQSFRAAPLPAPDAYATGTSDDHGFFRENCTGWAFDVYGNHLFGASTPLDGDRVELSGGSVVIDTADRSSTTRGWPTAAAR